MGKFCLALEPYRIESHDITALKVAGNNTTRRRGARVSINNAHHKKVLRGKRARMSPQRVRAREINWYVNKAVDNYVDDHG
jgi:hypothetical protein